MNPRIKPEVSPSGKNLVAVFVRTRLTGEWNGVHSHDHRSVALFVRTRLTTLPPMPNPDLHSLPRLERWCYQAFAAVHWTMKVEPAVPGWLTEPFHGDFRTVLLHACAREKLFCPAYCLMPDHLHLMWLGFRSKVIN